MRSGADLNGDNLRIYRAYLQISDHCRVTFRVMVRVRNMVRVRAGVGVADCCIQTAGKSDKIRINHVIKTDQWRSALQIRPAPHFVVSPEKKNIHNRETNFVKLHAHILHTI